MKSPIKDLTTKAPLSLNVLKKLIPKGSIIDSYLFYSGEIEFSLCQSQRFVNAHTTSPYIYEFWTSLFDEGNNVYDIANCDLFKFEPDMFPILQEQWYQYGGDPCIRAALFFILNRCSSLGLISSGELSTANYNPIALSHLKRFTHPSNFYVNNEAGSSFIDTLRPNPMADFMLIPCGDFSYNLFEAGKNRGVEETPVHHSQLREILREERKKWIVCYNHHPSLSSFYDQENIIMIDKYGRPITESKDCEVMVIYNFD
mgnify:CR=1 FL=1